MSRLKKQERQKQLQEKLNITPFLTDEDLASHFSVSVPTIRLDRLELGIPELRERIRVMATGGYTPETAEHLPYEVVGELIDVTAGQQALSMLRTTVDMEDQFGYIEPQYLYAQANSLAKVVMGTTVCSAEVGNIKYKSPVRAGTNLVAKAEIVRRRGNKFFIWVIIRDKIKEVFRAKFIMESIENRV
ncbi:transcription factor FapR [Veillonella rodentium]|uniref:Fatty acid and phospholipid biosynthesis regulator n=2 Tax=Veillonella TaxID=29465 RepID=A0A239YUW4_9FIRM|nr:transcription factor FapR [Veillonella rodentium]SNV62024.1 Fatty acid and phospholipid biosynthesis regulator [Veillonella rodentium]